MLTKRLALLALLLSILAAVAPAQIVPVCPVDDGFDVGCCNIPQPNLPFFPNMSVGGLYGCLLDCNLEAQFNVTTTIGSPLFITCDLAVIPVTVTSAAVVGPNFGGFLLGKYTRTWSEILTNGTMRQVWRFLVNGDLTYGATITAALLPCPVPPCSFNPVTGATNLPVHFTGHIDYARDCVPTSTGVPPWSVALNINHVTGCLNHAPFSARPLVGFPAHNDRTYCLVAPGNFIFGPAPVPAGPLVADTVRSAALNLGTPVPYQCFGEAHVANFGNVAVLNTYCYGCPPVAPALFGSWHDQTINGAVNCGPLTVLHPFHTVPIPGVFPSGMVSMEIGTYVGINPDAFPTGRQISLDYGVMQYFDPCLPNDFPFYVFTGVGHTGGNPAILFGSTIAGAVVNEFIDLQSMELPNAAGVFGPGIGALVLPRKVWCLNTL